MSVALDRYSRPAAAIHWISALLILLLLATGFRAGFATDEATKIAALRRHRPVAGFVLILTLVRLIRWWRFDQKPAPLGTSPHWQEVAAIWTHRALYVLILGLLASGIAMSAMAGLPGAVFGSAPMPELADLPPRLGHGIAARLIAAAVLLHAVAALYHHFVLKDATLRRMWVWR